LVIFKTRYQLLRLCSANVITNEELGSVCVWDEGVEVYFKLSFQTLPE